MQKGGVICFIVQETFLRSEMVVLRVSRFKCSFTEGRQVLVTWPLSPGTGQGTSCHVQKRKKKFYLWNCSSGLTSFMNKLQFDCREKLPLLLARWCKMMTESTVRAGVSKRLVWCLVWSQQWPWNSSSSYCNWVLSMNSKFFRKHLRDRQDQWQNDWWVSVCVLEDSRSLVHPSIFMQESKWKCNKLHLLELSSSPPAPNSERDTELAENSLAVLQVKVLSLVQWLLSAYLWA